MNAHHGCSAIDADCVYEALDAAESILRYTPQFSTNCGGTKPGMTTQEALRLVRVALARVEAERAKGAAEFEAMKIAAE
jgi:hypothetical protein